MATELEVRELSDQFRVEWQLPTSSLEGCTSRTKNAQLLLDDARLLMERSPARALSLAILAMEETAKVRNPCGEGMRKGRRMRSETLTAPCASCRGFLGAPSEYLASRPAV